MATKIEYEVSVDTAKAKRRLRTDLSTIEAGAPGRAAAPSASAVGESADKAARSLSNLASSSERASPAISAAVRAFAGLGISMAASYAANALPEGSAAAKGIGYAGSIAGGALAGSALGPWGAAGGAVIGGVKQLLEDTGKENSALLDFNASELRHREAVEWKERLQSLTDLGDSQAQELLEEKLRQVRDALAQKKEAEAKIVEDIRQYIENGEYYSANFAQQSLAANRSQQAQLDAAEQQMQKRLDSLGEDRELAPSHSPIDSLSRIGADFVGAQAAVSESIARNTERTNSILGRIERKMSKGGTF